MFTLSTYPHVSPIPPIPTFTFSLGIHFPYMLTVLLLIITEKLLEKNLIRSMRDKSKIII